MTVEEIINDVIDNSSEWSEMSADPAMFIARVLANKIVQLQNHIEYLEKRLEHVSR